MKKFLLASVFIVIAVSVKATWYYQPYPLTVVQTNNGSQDRLECSVYDSSLASVQTYNTPYYDFVTDYKNVNGVLVYSGNNVNFPVDHNVACVIYDFEIHQWKTYLHSETDFGSTYVDVANGFVEFSIEWPSGYHTEYEAGYYDLVSHAWKIDSHTSEAIGGVSGISQNIHTFDNGDDFPTVILGTYNPNNHDWTGLASTGSIYGGYSFMLGNATGGVNWYPGMGDPSGVIISTLDPETNIPYSINNYINGIDLCNFNSGIISFRELLTNIIYFSKFDASQHQWKTNTFPSANISNWVSGQGVIAFRNNTGTMVTSAVYNFLQHTWRFDSVATPSVSSLAINNGTVTWNNGSGTVIRGYHPSTGWGNYPTTLQAVFYLSNLASSNSGNLVFVRDYSIGATSVSYTLGDGMVSTEGDFFHLYKIAGTYLYTGAANTADICMTATNSSGSSGSCQHVSCPTLSAGITASGPTSFCSGGSVNLTVTSLPGWVYQWKKNGVNISGANTYLYSATTSGNYSCLITNSCGNNAYTTVPVTVNAVPSATITPSGPTNFCAGGSVTLNANTGAGLTYQWRKNSINISGATSSSYIANTTGTFNVVITNAAGCSKGATGVNVTGQPSLTITPSGPTHFCTGGNVTLAAVSGQAVTYQWRKNGSNISGATSSSYVASTTGIYNCIVTNSFGCSKAGTGIPVTGPPSAVISANGPTTFCAGGSVLLSAPGGYTYQWLKNSANIGGATQQNYSAAAAGNYKVQVTDAFGCSKITPTTNQVTVTIPCRSAASGTDESSDNLVVNIYPNPTSGWTSLDITSGRAGTADVQVTDILGKIIFEKSLEIMEGDNQLPLDLRPQSKGIYLVRVTGEGLTKISKVIKAE